MSPRSTRALLAVGLGLSLLWGLGPPALAERAEPDQPSVSLRLSPAVVEVAHGAEPVERTLRVDNTGSEPVRVATEVAEFTVTERGATQFSGPAGLSAAEWVEVDTDEFELGPDERREVGVTIDVPDDAEPGERYVSVIFAVPGRDSEGNISLTHRVAAKLYIEVPGDQVHHLELGDLEAPAVADSLGGGPAAFELAVHNRGNVHRRFQEDSRLFASSGSREFAFENFTVLGDSSRVVRGLWPDPPIICWCAVEVQVDDGRGGVETASTRLLFVPLRLTLALVVAAGGLGLLLVARRLRQAPSSQPATQR